MANTGRGGVSHAGTMSLILSRRHFLRQTAVAFAAAAAASAHATSPPAAASSTSSSSAAAAPSNRVNLALIGARNMGWNDLAAMLRAGNARCVALCDVDASVLDSRKAELAEKHHALPADFLATGDYRRVLDRKDVDAVVIGTPDHWHCRQFVDACAAGKDVHVQKPVANSIAECDVMVEAARRHGRIVQVGQQQRGGAYWRELVAFIQSGALGRVARVDAWANFRYTALKPAPADSAPPSGVDYDLWLGPAPARPFNTQRFHGTWRCFWNHGGGLLTDWGVHLLDIALWAMGATALPRHTFATGGKLAAPDGGHETFDTLSAAWQFDDFLLTWNNNTILERGPFDKNYGLAFWGASGLVVANRNGWDFYARHSKTPARSLAGDGWANEASLARHAADFLDCVRARNPRTACTLSTGAHCAKLAHLGNLSARLGGVRLEYDGTVESVLRGARVRGPAALAEAAAILRPAYRAPWKFPEEYLPRA